MASIIPGQKLKYAKRTVWFHFNGKRRAVHFPAMSFYDAVAVKEAIEDLIAAKRSGNEPMRKTQSWVIGLGEQEAKKLCKIGLIEPPAKKLLADYLDQYIDERNDLKASTKRKWNSTYRELLKFFSKQQPIAEITPADAEQWRRQLGGKRTINENTRRKHTAVAKVFFNAAVKKRLLDENPFANLKATILADPTRFHFVTRRDVERLIDACPDAEWRLIIALARYGGLRCPSEILRLRWHDLNWEHLRMTVTSTKTADHVGKGTRIVPIFPELAPHLEDAQQLTAANSEYVITRYRSSNSNLRTQLLRIMKRASVKPWPKLFQNMRSTRQTELADTFPAHVVCAWMGNSRDVAREHYLQVTDEHFEAANLLERIAEDIASQPQTGSAIPTQSVEKLGDCHSLAQGCTSKMTPTGLEPVLPA